jgi:hypothetical protein
MQCEGTPDENGGDQENPALRHNGLSLWRPRRGHEPEGTRQPSWGRNRPTSGCCGRQGRAPHGGSCSVRSRNKPLLHAKYIVAVHAVVSKHFAAKSPDAGAELPWAPYWQSVAPKASV